MAACEARFGPVAVLLERRIAYKQQQLEGYRDTRDNVVRHIEQHLSQQYPHLCRLPGGIRVVYSGSYSNFVQARNGHFDFDVLWVFGVGEMRNTPPRDVAIECWSDQRPRVSDYLEALASAARSYRNQPVTVDAPSVTFTSNRVSFDLLPALCVGGDSGVYFVPYGAEHGEKERVALVVHKRAEGHPP